MTWFAVHDQTTGRLLSVGEVVAIPLPAGLVAKALSGPPPDNMMWNTTTKAFDTVRPAPPFVTKIDEFMAQTEVASMSTANKNSIRTVVTRIFGPNA